MDIEAPNSMIKKPSLISQVDPQSSKVKEEKQAENAIKQKEENKEKVA